VGELHRSTAKLLEVMVWLEKGRGELSMAAGRGCGGGPVKAIEQKKSTAGA
jgi:hypothetical protein